MEVTFEMGSFNPRCVTITAAGVHTMAADNPATGLGHRLPALELALADCRRPVHGAELAAVRVDLRLVIQLEELAGVTLRTNLQWRWRRWKWCDLDVQIEELADHAHLQWWWR